MSPAPRRGAETVLVIEDDDLLRSFLRAVLESGGFTVLSPANVAGAVAMAEEHRGPIHLVLADVCLPLTSGPQVVFRICSLRPEMRLLYMSGYPAEILRERQLVPPGAPLIEKPISAKALLARVREVLHRPSP